MLETYRGILRDNRIEWVGDPPPWPAREQGVLVHITLLGPVTAPTTEQGRRMAEALERLAFLNAAPGGPEPDRPTGSIELRE